MTPWKITKTVIALAVTVGALLFLARALHASWSEFSSIVVTVEFLLTAVLLSVAYGACLFILSSSWGSTLQRCTPQHVPAISSAYVYSISNIAKYLPGNVFHFAGRQILGARLGWSHGAIARATLLEIGAIVASILLLALLATGFGPADVANLIAPRHLAAPVAQHGRPFALAGLILIGTAFYLFSRRQTFDRLFGLSAGSILHAVAMCALFFSLYAGLAMLFAYRLAILPHSGTLLSVGLAYLLAWLAGFVVPGAPGGLGVRESMLVLLLAGSGYSDSANALGLGLGLRFVSTLGDAIAAAAALLLVGARRNANPQRRHPEWNR